MNILRLHSDLRFSKRLSNNMLSGLFYERRMNYVKFDDVEVLSDCFHLLLPQ